MLKFVIFNTHSNNKCCPSERILVSYPGYVVYNIFDFETHVHFAVISTYIHINILIDIFCISCSSILDFKIQSLYKMQRRSDLLYTCTIIINYRARIRPFQ